VLITRAVYDEYKLIDERLRNKPALTEVFRNADYVVYRLGAAN